MPEVPYVPYVLGGPDGLLHVDFGGDCSPLAPGVPTCGGLQDSKNSRICPSTESGSSL